MSDGTERPRSPHPHDDELLGCFWAQLRHGRPLSATQAAHLFYIGYSAGQTAERKATVEAVEILTAGQRLVNARPWWRRVLRLRT